MGQRGALDTAVGKSSPRGRHVRGSWIAAGRWVMGPRSGPGDRAQGGAQHLPRAAEVPASVVGWMERIQEGWTHIRRTDSAGHRVVNHPNWRRNRVLVGCWGTWFGDPHRKADLPGASQTAGSPALVAIRRAAGFGSKGSGALCDRMVASTWCGSTETSPASCDVSRWVDDTRGVFHTHGGAGWPESCGGPAGGSEPHREYFANGEGRRGFSAAVCFYGNPKKWRSGRRAAAR